MRKLIVSNSIIAWYIKTGAVLKINYFSLYRKMCIAVKVGFKEFYGHDYLSAKEQMEGEEETGSQEDDDFDETPSKLPHTSEEWQKYQYVLPSVETINYYISLLAAQEEAMRALSAEIRDLTATRAQVIFYLFRK